MLKKKGLLTILVLCLLSICLVGCGDKDYTRKDADKLAKKYSRKCKFVEEQVLGEKETIWTYYDEKLGWNFTVHEKPYVSGFDGMHWDARGLRTDYDDLIRDYILEMDEVKSEGITKDFEYNQDYILVETNDRADLNDKVKCLQNAVSNVSKKTKKNSYHIKVNVEFCNASETFNLNNKELKGIEDAMLKRAFVEYDEDILNQYGARELRQFVKAHSRDEVQFVHQNGRVERTGLLTYSGNTNVSKKAFKHWLETNGYVVSGTDEEYTFTTSTGETITVDYHTDGNGDRLSFYYLTKTLGLKEVKVDS